MKRKYFVGILFLFLLFGLIACGAGTFTEPINTNPDAVSAQQTIESHQTAIHAIEGTFVALSATPTPTFTLTPSPTPTEVPNPNKVKQLINDALAAHGDTDAAIKVTNVVFSSGNPADDVSKAVDQSALPALTMEIFVDCHAWAPGTCQPAHIFSNIVIACKNKKKARDFVASSIVSLTVHTFEDGRAVGDVNAVWADVLLYLNEEIVAEKLELLYDEAP